MSERREWGFPPGVVMAVALAIAAITITTTWYNVRYSAAGLSAWGGLSDPALAYALALLITGMELLYRWEYRIFPMGEREAFGRTAVNITYALMSFDAVSTLYGLNGSILPGGDLVQYAFRVVIALIISILSEAILAVAITMVQNLSYEGYTVNVFVASVVGVFDPRIRREKSVSSSSQPRRAAGSGATRRHSGRHHGGQSSGSSGSDTGSASAFFRTRRDPASQE